MSENRPAETIPFTVAVLSHQRPKLLRRVLGAVAQLDYPNFEIVVVGDQPSLAAYGLPDWLARQVRYVAFAGANICRSRNLAVAAAAGEMIAFCDDDAVPEPDWLSRLARAFRFPDVGGVGGLVRCGDGIGIEWAGGVFDRSATERPMRVPDEMRLFDAETQVYGNEFIGTMGANSAFRREAILSVGGFDESFHYYLDETDLMLRLAEAGWNAALVRNAEVHHLREANDVRDALRTPRSLHEIAASKAYFCRCHLDGEDVKPNLAKFRVEKAAELDPYIRLGLIRRRDRDRLMAELEDGLAVGLARERALPMVETFAEQPFERFERPAPQIRVALLSGWGIPSLVRTRRLARRLAASGAAVSCFSFHSGTRRRSVEFSGDVWWHMGGTWRLDHRAGRRRVLGRFARADAELERVHAKRCFDVVLGPKAAPDAMAVSLPGWPSPLFARAMPGSGYDLAEAVARLTSAARDAAGTTPADMRPAPARIAAPFDTALEAGRASTNVTG